MRGWYLPSLVQRTLCLLSDVLEDAFAPHFPRILPGIVHRAALDVGIHVPLPDPPCACDLCECGYGQVHVSVDEGVGVSGVDGGESFAVNIRGVGEQRISYVPQCVVVLAYVVMIVCFCFPASTRRACKPRLQHHSCCRATCAVLQGVCQRWGSKRSKLACSRGYGLAYSLEPFLPFIDMVNTSASRCALAVSDVSVAPWPDCSCDRGEHAVYHVFGSAHACVPGCSRACTTCRGGMCNASPL